MTPSQLPPSPKREDDDSLLLEGAFLVERALRAGLELSEIFCVPARSEWAHALRDTSAVGAEPPAIRVLPEEELAAVAGYPFHRGVLALGRRPRERRLSELAGGLGRGAGSVEGASRSEASTLVALPETRDPENIGSIFRSAAALGCDGLLLGPTCPDPLSRRALRVGMGAPLSLPWARLRDPGELGSLASFGFRLSACVLDPGALDLRAYDRPPRLVLVFGNEAYGLSPAWRELCDDELTLPMRGGADSLNVGVAAALFLYTLTSIHSQNSP